MSFPVPLLDIGGVDLAVVSHMCDRISVMSRGEIVEIVRILYQRMDIKKRLE